MERPLPHLVGHEQTACVTGRLQPVHEGHLELFRLVLSRHERLIVAITNPDAASRSPDETNPGRHLPSQNPFTYYERLLLVAAALGADGVSRDRYEVVPFPLHTPEVCADYVPRRSLQYVRAYSQWERRKAEVLRAYGYDVELIEARVKHMSSTRVRNAMIEGEQWGELVAPGTTDLLETFLEEHPIMQRMGT